MFDCVLPTWLARNGTAFTATGTLNLKTLSSRATRIRSNRAAPVRLVEMLSRLHPSPG